MSSNLTLANAADELYSVLVTHAKKNDDNFDLDDSAQTVRDEDGSRDRGKLSIAAYRLTEFTVGDRGVYRKSETHSGDT